MIMRRLSVLSSALFGVLLLAAMPAQAGPRAYNWQSEGSTVGFVLDFGEDEVSGNMPVAQADLQLDFATPSRSAVHVTVDASQAQSSIPFVVEALKGPGVLDTANTPMLSFESRKTTETGRGQARIDGDITVRGVTRPISLNAQLYRPEGSERGDLSNLTIVLTGALSRADFGATGWSDMVGDEVRLTIRAHIQEAS
ncbi:MAG: YceI family protein [Maritimibacter sp.]